MKRSLRLSLASLAAALFLLGCSNGGGSSPAPDPSSVPSPSSSAGGPVRTEADAVARVVEHEPRFAGIRARDPDLIGQAAWYDVAAASGVGAYIVTMRIGWGDCPSGCIEEHTWTYAVLPDGKVKLQSEGGSTVPPEAWPAPGAGGGGSAQTGLHITAVAGPTCPVERVPPDPACAARPVPHVSVAIFDDAGNDQGTLVLDAAGEGTIALEPGAYIVNGQGGAGLMNGPEAQRVEVEAGRVTEVELMYDTGIR
jgi:hypothetical protein